MYYNLTKVVRSGTKWRTNPKEVEGLFIGEYEHSVDAKGRLIMPAKLREEIGETFIVTKGLDGCLFAYSKKEWTAFEEKLGNLPLSSKNARDFTRFFLSGAIECEIDKQGRFLITSNLREFAGLEKDVVIIGVNTRIEIWSKEKWDAENAAFVDNSDEVALQMEDLGI